MYKNCAVQSKPSTGHLNFLCNDSCPRAYFPYFSRVHFLSAVRQPIKLLVVDGIGLGDGQTVTFCCGGCCCSICLVSIPKGERARASRARGDRLGSYAATYIDLITNL